jgi:cytochrome c oxidase subunit 3
MPETKATRLGHDGADDGFGGNGNGQGPHRPDVPTAKIGMWLFVGSLSMFFAALVAAYAYRLDDKPNYYFPWPPSLWVSTGAIVLSSVTLWVAHRAVRAGLMRKGLGYLGTTLALGWIFVLSQFVAWLLLRHAGIFAPTNPIAGQFYLLTSIHGFHLIIGIGWLIYLFYLAKHGIITAKSHLALDLGALYWHFMTVVWIAFFVMIVI